MTGWQQTSAAQPTLNGHPNGHTSNGHTSNGHTSNGHTSNGHTRNGSNLSTSPIAIVGMACRFAGGITSPATLWELCADGRDGWSPIPKERFDVKSLLNVNCKKDGNDAVGGYFMSEDVARFDAGFFNFPVDVASAMDPQVRLLLEIVYEATEDAGIPIENLAGTNTSVFSGCYAKDYHDLQTRGPETVLPSFLTENATATMSNRISHFYGLQGVSMSIDTGDSSGLACLHQGCQTIRNGESDISIVGASSAMLNPDMFLAMSSLGTIGADGKCYTWDERPQGYGRGEGVAALVIKSLDAALRDGDRVHAVIRETGLNQNGMAQSITSPSINAQVQLIRDCYRRAGLDFSETAYIEAHMTGIPADDLAEAQALSKTFGESRSEAADAIPVLIGSVKTNIGNTGSVSGLAAIIKTAFAMKNRKVPANPNYKVGNPENKLDDRNLMVPRSLASWPEDKPLRASINNFGYGGTNAHVILEVIPLENAEIDRNGFTTHSENKKKDISRLFTISAKGVDDVRTMATNLASHLREGINNKMEINPEDLAYTLAERRSRLGCLATVRARTLADLFDRLESSASLKISQPASKKPQLGFVFNGQGAQWHAMGRELLASYTIFASAIKQAGEVFRSYGADWSLEDELMRDAKSTRVSEIHLSQSITVALQICLVQLLRSWGIHPLAVVSHSSGEIAAAFTVGALSLREALGVVYYRDELARKYKERFDQTGGMLAVGINANDAERYLAGTSAGGRVVVGCINSPKSVTLSGDMEDLDEVAGRLERDSLFVRKLKVPLAYHSHHMLPMAAEYAERLHEILPDERSWTADVMFASPVTGSIVDSPNALTPAHWVNNLTKPVLFSDAFEAISKSVDAVVEIGPHSTLSGPIWQILKGRKMPYVSCLKRQVDAVETMQELAVELLGLGQPLSLGAVNSVLSTEQPKFVPDLPTYPWNHKSRYWVESQDNKATRYKRFPPHELLGVPVSGAAPLATEWRNVLRLSDVPWLVDHQVNSQVILPSAVYISMAIEAMRLLAEELMMDTTGFRIRRVNFLNSLTIQESSAVEIRLSLQPVDSTCTWYDFRVCSAGPSDPWVENCRGEVSAVEGKDQSTIFDPKSFLDAGEDVNEHDAAALLSRAQERGIEYRQAFRSLTYERSAANRAIANLHITSNSNSYIIHPTTLDCIFQASYISLPDSISQGLIILPRSIQSMFIPSNIHKRAGEELQVFSELQKLQKKGFTSEVIATNAGCAISVHSPLQIEKLCCQAMPRGTDSASSDIKLDLSQCKSTWEPLILHSIPKAIKKSMSISLNDEEATLEEKMVRASYYFISDAVSQLERASRDDWEQHHKTLHDWMVVMVARGKKGDLGPGSALRSRASRGMKQALFDELSRGPASAQLLVQVGAKLAEIIRGKMSPQKLMMAGDLLSKYYMELPKLKSRSYNHLSRIVELFAVEHPSARVLEIGGATGDATKVVLEAFSARGSGVGTLLGQYTFTDVKSDLFEVVRSRVAAWDDLIDFQTLNIEMEFDRPSNALVAGSFDLIVASMVLHATKNLDRTMKNVRRLLKPGGKLLLVETTQDRIDIQLIFSTLPEWWSGEEPSHEISPNASLKAWDEVLRKTGFTGVNFQIGDCDQPQFQSSSVILSSAAAIPELPPAVSVVYTDPVPEAWNRKLANKILEKTGISLALENWQEILPEDKLYIFTAEMSGPFVDSMDHASFHKLQQLLARGYGALWLSCSGSVDGYMPTCAATYRLLGKMRQENATKPYTHLDFEKTSVEPWTEDKIDHIIHVLQHSINEKIKNEDRDWEFAVKNSILHVPRIFPIGEGTTFPTPRQQPFHQPGQPLVWNPSELIFVDNGQVEADVPSEMVEAEVKVFGVQPRYNITDDEDIMVYGWAGVVTRVGSDTQPSGLRVGDRVGGLSKGAFTSPTKSHWTSTVKIPEVSFVDAACIPVAYGTAYHTLINIAKLSHGESVLIYPATNDVGQAAIVVAQNLGADVFATFDNESERDTLIDKYNIPLDRLFSVRDVRIATALKAQTKGKGVDAILNSSASQTFESIQDCISRFGRFVHTVGTSVHTEEQLDWAYQERSATFTRIDMMEVAEFNSLTFREAMEAGVRIYQNMGCRNFPIWPVVQYPIWQMGEALQHQIQKDHTAKVVVVVQPDDVVNVLSPLQPLSLADAEVMYPVVGGPDGIRPEAAQGLMEKGNQRRQITPEESQVIISLKSWSDLVPNVALHRDRRFGTLQLAMQRSTSAPAIAEEATNMQTLDPSEMLLHALSYTRNDATAVEQALVGQLAAIFNVNANEINLGLTLAEHGVDSVVAVEFRNWLVAAGRAKLSLFEILQAASIHELAILVIARSKLE